MINARNSNLRKSKVLISFILMVALLSTMVSMTVLASTLGPGFSEEIIPDNPTPTPGASPAFDLTDPATGVTVAGPAGALPMGTTGITLLVKLAEIEVSDQDSVRKLANDAASKYGDEINKVVKINKLYEIVLLDQNGNVISQFDGELTVTIPVTDGSTDVAYFNEKNVTIQILASSLKNGYISFKTTHFSYYALVEISDIPKVNPPTGGGDGGGKNPPTGDNVLVFVILAGMSLAAVGTYKKYGKSI